MNEKAQSVLNDSLSSGEILPSPNSKQITPGLTLLFLAPFFGELLSCHQTPLEFFNPINFLVLSLPYGFGALICRELTVRWKKGWVCLLLLAVAYGLYEEALVARSVFDPEWGELGFLQEYDHFAGINWTFSMVLIHFHVVVSIGCSIKLTELLFPSQRTLPWISDRGLAGCGIGLALWLPILWLLNPYTPPFLLYGAAWIIFIGLILLARYTAQPRLKSKRNPPRPIVFYFLGAVNMVTFFFAVFFLPEENIYLPLWLTVAFLVVLDLLTFWLIKKWSGNFSAWDDRHRLALMIGFLTFFLVACFEGELTGFDGSSIVGIATMAGFWKLHQKIGRRIERNTFPQL